MAIEGSICEIRLGLPGSGKSLDQTYNAVLPHLLAGEEVWCCYWINWNKPNFHYFQPGDFEAIRNLRNCVVVFDELAQMWDPRDWENEGLGVRAWWQLHRHAHIDIYANTQDVSLVAKTVGIVADQWIKCTQIERSWLIDIICKLLNIPKRISIFKEYLTYQQLKKIANGWELGEDVAIDIERERINFSIKNLIINDLNDYKIELVHKYCSKCASRQGSQILKEDTDKECFYNEKGKYWGLRTAEFCPKHHDQLLEVRETGLYDTDYTPEVKEKPYKLIKQITCASCGSNKYVR